MGDSGIFDFIPALPILPSDPLTEAPVISIAESTGDPTWRSVFWNSSPNAMVVEIEIRRKP